jgi:formate/nitrite transporter FocA (FNT family)
MPEPHHEPSPQIPLSEHEKEEVEHRIRPRAQVLHEAIRLEGEHELHRPATALAWSGLAAGLSMGFSLVAMGLARAMLPNEGWTPLLVSLGYCVGFLIVIVARQQLFTENTLTPVLPLLHDKTLATARRLLRLWAIVLVSNLTGTLVIAFVLQRTAVFPDAVKAQFAALGREAVAGSFGIHLLRAIFSGWLIAIMEWMLPGARSPGFIVLTITYLIGLGSLSHVIAGSVECLYAVVAGYSSWGEYFGHFLAPVLLGNVLGGTTIVAALNHAQIAADEG